MPNGQGQITVRQALILFIISTLSPAIRLFPQLCSKIAQNAGWLAPVVSTVALLISFGVLHSFFGNSRYDSLGDVFENALGRAVGKALLVIYLLWALLQYFLYIRYYAERLLSSIFPNTHIYFFLITMLALVYMGTRGSIVTFARFGEISIVIFFVVFVFLFIALITGVRINNLLPVTYYDALPVLKSTYPIVSIWGYIVMIFFLGESIKNKYQLRKYRSEVTVFISVMTTLMLITVIGTLGYVNAEKMPLPFFNATKTISILESFDRFEALLLSAWVISDFILITLFAKIACSIAKKIFNASGTRCLAAPIALMGFVGSLLIANNRFEFEIYTQHFGLSTNILLFYVIPILTWAVGKLRKKI